MKPRSTPCRHAARALVAPLAIFSLLLVGCRTLPDAAPFAEASLRVRTAVASSGDAVVAQMRSVTETDDSGSPVRILDAQADALESAWNQQVAHLDATVQYARSIQAVIDAGNSGAQSARAIADSVSRLAGAVGIVPGAQAVGTATDVAAFVYAQVARVRAARTLEEALDHADPAVQRIAALIDDNLAQLEGQLADATLAYWIIETSSLNNAIFYRDQLVEERDAIYSQAGAGLSQQETQRLLTIDAELEATREWHDPLQARLEASNRRQSDASELLALCRRAVREWAGAHTEMASALRERRVPSIENLTEMATEIRDLIRKVREQ
jgi:hypothetical protein